MSQQPHRIYCKKVYLLEQLKRGIEPQIQVTFLAICSKNFKEWLKQSNINISKTKSGLLDVSLIYIWITKIFLVFNTVALSSGKKMPTNINCKPKLQGSSCVFHQHLLPLKDHSPQQVESFQRRELTFFLE